MGNETPQSPTVFERLGPQSKAHNSGEKSSGSKHSGSKHSGSKQSGSKHLVSQNSGSRDSENLSHSVKMTTQGPLSPRSTSIGSGNNLKEGLMVNSIPSNNYEDIKLELSGGGEYSDSLTPKGNTRSVFLKVIFLCETKNRRRYLENIMRHLGCYDLYTVEPIGIGGGLALMWKEEIKGYI